MKQIALIDFKSPIGKVFYFSKGQRKTKRPLSTKHPIHIILHSSHRTLRKNETQIISAWNRFAKRFGVKTYQLTVAADHIHGAVRLHSRELYCRFIQALTGTIARNHGVKWERRPTTRIATWGRDFKRLLKYIKLNWLEAEGFIDYQPERTRNLPYWLRL